MIEERSDLCPAAETLARGAAGELPLAERRAFVRHLSACDSCTELVRRWPEARRWAERAAAELRPGPPAGVRSWRPGVWLLAAAAALVVGVGVVAVTRFRPTESPSYRTGAAEGLRSLLEPDRPLPRAAFRLRWTPGPAGSRYSVLVAREDLAPIARAEGLTVPELLVAERLLADLPPGSRVLWKVRATPPGSSALASPTFVTTVE